MLPLEASGRFEENCLHFLVSINLKILVHQQNKNMSRIRAGIDLERLERVGPMLERFVGEGNLHPGVHFLLWRRGELVEFRCVGFRDRETQLAVKEDTISRMYLMTKPLVSVALMMLFEEGQFQLTSPASEFIPELRNSAAFSNVSALPTGLTAKWLPKICGPFGAKAR